MTPSEFEEAVRDAQEVLAEQWGSAMLTEAVHQNLNRRD